MIFNNIFAANPCGYILCSLGSNFTHSTEQSIDAGDSSLPESINPNNFPAKLWRLVNNPVNEAIRWDRNGLVIVIDQRLFEEQILSPSNSSSSSSSALDNKDTFKTTNFSSFVRQLNLYGFKKADDNMRDCCHADQVQFHYFYHANFKRNHPELVASLRRLTVLNKAKIQAGLEVKNRGPSRYLRYSDEGRDKDVKRGMCHRTTVSREKPNVMVIRFTVVLHNTGIFCFNMAV